MSGLDYVHDMFYAYVRLSSPRGGGAKPLDPKDVRVPVRVPPDDTGTTSFRPARIPNTPAPPQPGSPLRILSGEPMPKYPLPPMVFGLQDRSAASSDNMDDWYNRWIKPLMQQ